MEDIGLKIPSIESFGPALKQIIDRTLILTPAHGKYLSKRFAQVTPDEAVLLEKLARVILDMTGDNLDQCCRDYDWLTQIVLEEELYFRRNDQYRLETLEQAIEQVYSRTEYMTSYMNGLLMTQLWWSNHTRAMLSYQMDFLSRATGRCMEIGPGHGLLLLLASEAAFNSVEALDISEASTDLTREGLRRAGKDPDSSAFRFHVGNLFDEQIMSPFRDQFDGVVFSEVLEHLDRPADAMRTLFSITKPGGLVFIHVPINSPAPDHLFLLRSPAEALDFVSGFGFNVSVSRSFPGANLTLDRAIATQSTISCVFVLEKPANP